MPAFLIDLATLPRGYSRTEVESEAQDLDLSAAEWPGPIRGDLEVELHGEQVSVRGRLAAIARQECVSCLVEFDLPLEAAIVILAERTGTSDRREQELLERDEYMLFHDGRRLDLRTQAREALLLELPISPRCREDCKGLCPKCGANRNEGPCLCA